MFNPLKRGERFSATATHATTAVATEAAATGKRHFITDIAASSDKTGAILLVKDGDTTIWQAFVPADGSISHQFLSPLAGTKGNAVSVEVDGTSACKANVAGYTL